MDKLSNGFTKFVNYSLKLLMIPILYVCISLLAGYTLYSPKVLPALFLIITAAAVILLHLAIQKGVEFKVILSAIIIIALIIRISYVLSINNHPVSDFKMIYRAAGNFLNGNYSDFKGAGYAACYPHVTALILYYALIRRFFAEPLIVIKIFNSIFSTINVIFIYLIVQEVFKDKKKALWAAFITAIYPPLVIYSAVYCSENIAIPFYLSSIYIFLLVVGEKKKLSWLMLSGLLLSIGHLFRMVGQVMVIAFCLYIFIYVKTSLMKRFRGSLYILISFVVPMLITSQLLLTLGITQNQLWKGKIPFWISVVKGTNMESWGRWSIKDAYIPRSNGFDTDKIARASKTIIWDRLTSESPFQLAKFYVHKFSYQWRQGDFSASFWAQCNTLPENISIDLQDNALTYFQLFFSVLIVSSYIGLYNRKYHQEIKVVNLFYIIFCGYALLYLITESQDRYSFIVCWLFIVLAFTPNWN